MGGNLTFATETSLLLSFNGLDSTVSWADPFWKVNRSWTIYDLSTGTTTGLANLMIVGGNPEDDLGNQLSPTERGYFTTSLSGQDVMLNFIAVPEPSMYALTVTSLACGGYVAWRRRKRA